MPNHRAHPIISARQRPTQATPAQTTPTPQYSSSCRPCRHITTQTAIHVPAMAAMAAMATTATNPTLPRYNPQSASHPLAAPPRHPTARSATTTQRQDP